MLSRVIRTRPLQDEFNRSRRATSAQVVTAAEITAFPTVSVSMRQECERFQSLRGLHTSSEVLA